AKERELEQARLEITSRFGFSDPFDIASPYDKPALSEAARDLLAGSSDLAKSFFAGVEDLAALSGLWVARDVRGEWPQNLSARWLSDLFAGTPLLAGLSLDIGPLPKPNGASSFARALSRFGAAYARAAAGRDRPFVLAHDATSAHPMRRGALFSALL